MGTLMYFLLAVQVWLVTSVTQNAVMCAGVKELNVLMGLPRDMTVNFLQELCDLSLLHRSYIVFVFIFQQMHKYIIRGYN